MGSLGCAVVARYRLTDSELADFGILLFSAGSETVARHLGWAASVLDEYPEQRAELAKDFSLIPNAVEELLRYEPPSPVNARWTTRGLPAQQMRIGIHTAPVSVGNMGTPRRFAYTALGDSVKSV